MSSIAEKRVYGDAGGPTVLAVASAAGTATVGVAGDRVGEFGLVDRTPARDVTAVAGRLAVATETDVAVSTGPVGGDHGDVAFAESGFGPAVAVGAGGNHLVAAGADGMIAVRSVASGRSGDESGHAPTGRGDDWRTVATVPDPTAVDGSLVATEDGVFRLRGPRDGGERGNRKHGDGAPVIDRVALAGTTVADVTAAEPHAATADGLHRLAARADGETRRDPLPTARVFDDPVHAVASAPGSARVLAAGSDDVFERRPTGGDEDAWGPAPLPGGATGAADVAVVPGALRAAG
ncbi:MAG: hypothetical protein ABEJ42_04045, partial [Halobacteriaceae archaeon]